jgi:acyl-CoA thioester hydrolase
MISGIAMTKKDFSNCLTASEVLRIPFYDLDPAAIVWHGNYFKYFESARCTLLEDLAYSYEGMMESGYHWPVVDASVRFVRPLSLNQKVRVTAYLREWELRLVFDYRIEDEQDCVCTRGRTVQVPLDAKTLELSLGCPEILIENVQKRLQAQSRRTD